MSRAFVLGVHRYRKQTFLTGTSKAADPHRDRGFLFARSLDLGLRR